MGFRHFPYSLTICISFYYLPLFLSLVPLFCLIFILWAYKKWELILIFYNLTSILFQFAISLFITVRVFFFTNRSYYFSFCACMCGPNCQSFFFFWFLPSLLLCIVVQSFAFLTRLVLLSASPALISLLPLPLSAWQVQHQWRISLPFHTLSLSV